MSQLSKPSTKEPSNTTPGNQTNSYNINIQHQELKKGMHIADTLKSELNRKYKSTHIRVGYNNQSNTEDTYSVIIKSHFLVQDNKQGISHE